MQTSNGFELLARFGYAARGVVYLLIAGLALFATFGGGEQPSSEGALSSLLGQPFGKVLLGAMSVGLLGFALWRLAQGLLNADRRDKDLPNHLARAGKLVSAGAYLFLALLAAQLALGQAGSGSGGGSSESIASVLLGLPFGPVLLWLVGAGVMVAGGGQIYKGLSGRFKKRLRLPGSKEKLLAPVCTYGLAARGIVFLILGGFLIYSSFTLDPQSAGSVPEALDWVRGLPFGGVLYGVVALGLLAFAGYCGVLALYRRVDAPSARAVKRAVSGT